MIVDASILKRRRFDEDENRGRRCNSQVSGRKSIELLTVLQDHPDSD